MTHEAFQERLLDLAYGELSGREARKVEAHAASCEPCRAELARIRETRGAMSALADEPAPARGESVLLAAARERSRARKRGLPRWLFAGSIAAVAAVAVVAVSYRILEMRPGPLGTSDREALLGEARPQADVALAPEPPAGAAADAKEDEAPAPGLATGAPAPSPRERRRAAAPEGTLAREAAPAPAAKAKRAPAGEPSRFAEPPPSPYEGPRAEGLPSAPPAVAMAPALRGDAAPSTADRAGAIAPQAPPPAAAIAPQASRAPAAPRSAPAPDAVRRYEALRGEGRLTGEIRTFPGCAAEAWRKVERDPAGRVVAYVREGTIGGVRFRAEAIYGEDGRLARARALPLDGGAAPDAGALVPGDAAAAGIDAPPRCGP